MLNIYIWIASLILWIRSHPIKFSHIELLKKLLDCSTGSVTTRNLWPRSYPGTKLPAKFDHNGSQTVFPMHITHEPNSIYVYLYIIFEKISSGALDTPPPGGSKWIISVGDYVDNSFIALGSSDPREVNLELWGRVDDLSFFKYLSPFCFLLTEFIVLFSISYFIVLFSISYKILPYFVYYYCILLRMW